MTRVARGGTIVGMTRRWLVPTGLLLLSAVPVAAGAFRVAQLSTGAAVTPDNARFADDPVPVVVHIVTVTVFCVVGAFQFVPLRGNGVRRPAWHRVTGRILVPAGLGAALSGLWLSLFFPRPDDVGTLVTAFRLVFGAAMAGSVVLGLVAVRRRDFAGHRAWMIRGYAIGVGAGTQAFTHAVFIATAGPVDRTGKAFAMLAGWLVNLAVAEVVIRGEAHRKSLMGAAR
jgi:hypothetical protein